MQFLNKQLVLLSVRFQIQEKEKQNGKAKNTFYQCKYDEQESITAIF